MENKIQKRRGYVYIPKYILSEFRTQKGSSLFLFFSVFNPTKVENENTYFRLFGVSNYFKEIEDDECVPEYEFTFKRIRGKDKEFENILDKVVEVKK